MRLGDGAAEWERIGNCAQKIRQNIARFLLTLKIERAFRDRVALCFLGPSLLLFPFLCAHFLLFIAPFF